jgi:predicted phage tail component-like protein
MVKLNGIDIESVAPVIRNTITVSSPSVDVTWQENAIAHGARFVRKQYKPRKIDIDLYLPVENAEDRAKYINLLNNWACYDEPVALEIPSRPGQYIMAIASKLPGTNTREWWGKFSIEFTCGDPFFLDMDYLAIPCGLAFGVAGEGIASAYIQSTGSQTDPEWELDGGLAVALDGTFNGDLKVDLDENIVTLDCVSQMEYLTLASRFFDIARGVHVITGSGTLFYKQRWL